MTNAELIKGLRWCADESICCDDFSCEKCPYFDEKKDSCSVDEILHAAADALEAAEAEKVRLNTKCADLQSQINSMENEIEELLPKDGEWEERYIEDANPMFRRRFYCSRCGEWTTHGKTRYCPNCGAKMKGENDEQIH